MVKFFGPGSKIKSFGSQRLTFIIGIMVIIWLSLGLRLYRIHEFSSEYDEGAHFMVAWLLARGYALYSEIASAQLPFLYQPTAWLFALSGGPSLVLGRWVEIAYGLVGIVVIAALGRRLWQPSAGLWAALFLSLEQLYFYNSRLGIGSVAAAAMGGLAVLCALYYYPQGRRRWLILAGASYSLSLVIKPLSLFVGLILVGAVIARWWNKTPNRAASSLTWPILSWPGLLTDLLYLGGATLVLLLLCLIFYDTGELVNRLLFCRLSAKINSPRTLANMVEMLTNYVYLNFALSLLALGGLLMVIWQRNRAGLLVVAWLGLGLALLLAETAHRHHLVILDFPLALLAAYFLSQGTAAVLVQRRGLRQVSLMLALVGLLVWVGYQVITWTDYFSQPVNPEKHTTRLAAAQLLQQVTTPDQFVVSDDLAIPLVAQRLVIPQLADASSGSMGCNLANESLFMQQTSRNGAPIIFWTGRFVRAFPILRLWAATTYAQSEQFDSERFVFYNWQPPIIETPLTAQFGNVIALDGYNLNRHHPVTLTLFWRKLNLTDQNYKVTLRLLDPAGQAVAQLDREPFYGFYPTSSWPVGVLLPESIELNKIQPPPPPGRYTLELGLYDPDSLNMLSVSSNSVQDNGLVRLGELDW